MATNEAMVEANKFDKKFKSALRDYYIYGFKNYNYYEQHPTDANRTTLDDMWSRLFSILGDEWSWSEKQSVVMYASTDSQANVGNPVYKLFRFCLFSPDNLKYFFHIIFALSPEVTLTKGVSSLNIKDIYDKKKDKDKKEDSDLIYNIEENLTQLAKDLESGAPLSTRELFCFYPNEISTKKGYPNLNNQLKPLEEMGILLSKKKGRRNLWSLSPRKLTNILEVGTKADSHFKEDFLNLLEFYSSYFPMGEIGTFLLDRMGTENETPFRFKHDYYLQALDDYDLVDLLYAIENNYWCRIEYSNGISHSLTELLCYPLEIRVDSLQGREYLAYYEPYSRNYSFLRLEFIKSIKFYNDKEIKSLPSLTEKEITSDLKNARDALKYSWGRSPAFVRNGNAINKIQPYTVKMSIFYDPAKETYIKERMEREKRQGNISIKNNTIDFEIKVADPHELLPWVRSFYGRIRSISGIDNDSFTIKNDLKKFQKNFTDDLKINAQKKESSEGMWSLTTEQKKELNGKKQVKDIPPHNQLFNEMFDVMYFSAAGALMQICHVGSGGRAMLPSKVKTFVDNSFDKYIKISDPITTLNFNKDLQNILKESTEAGRFQSGCYVQERNILDIFSTPNKKEKEYDLVNYSEKRQPGENCDALLPLYSIDNSYDFYRDLLPLTKLECQWLLSILKDNKIYYFLTEEEINAVKSALNPEGLTVWEPLHVEKINYFNRFSHSEKDYINEQNVMDKLLKAIRKHKVVKMGSDKCKPILIEYSKRDDRFRCYFQTYDNKKIFLKNLSNIYSLEVLNENFNYSQAKSALTSYREENSKQLTVQFTNEKNVPDRILTEFSPWQKKCTYDPKKEIYTLTIYYQEDDQKEIIIRLMSYGASIYFPDKENPICRDIVSRIEKQITLFEQ